MKHFNDVWVPKGPARRYEVIRRYPANNVFGKEPVTTLCRQCHTLEQAQVELAKAVLETGGTYEIIDKWAKP